MFVKEGIHKYSSSPTYVTYVCAHLFWFIISRVVDHAAKRLDSD